MLEIFCAIYPEAKPFIQHLHLKKVSFKNVDCFMNEEETIRLSLTGVGKVKASSVVTSILEDSDDPFVLSFGSSAYLQEEHDDVYIANRITDIDTGMSYYPDVVWKLNIEECSFVCGSQLLSSSSYSRVSIKPLINIKEYLQQFIKEEPSYMLYDMESSAIYETANQWIGPERMIFMRFGSDNDSSSVSAESISKMAESIYPKVKEVIDLVMAFKNDSISFNETVISSFCEHIHATRSMESQVKQICLYCLNSDIDYQSIIQEYLNVDISNKEEGKRVFDEFRKKCCEE